MLIIGCDFHPGVQQVAVLDTETGRRWEGRLSHTGDQVRQFYSDLPRPVRVGLECSGYSLWFEDMLEELGIEYWIGDATKIRACEPRKQKTDRNDARLLLTLLEENRFPKIWVPDRATRDLRQLLMHRHKLVCMRSAIKNQLQAIALNRGVQKHKRLWSKEGREQLRTFPLPPWTRRRCDELLRLHEQWDQEIAELDKVVLEQAHAHPEANYLMQKVCGVGPITAMAVVLSLGPVSRFKNARKVASYAGLVPAEYSSGPHQRLGHITKQGSPFLRFALVEAAGVASRYDAKFKQVYWRLVERRGKSVAKVAIARKLLTRLYWLLRLRSEKAKAR
jgi:transposase